MLGHQVQCPFLFLLWTLSADLNLKPLLNDLPKIYIIVLQISDKSEIDKVGVMLYLDEKMEALESQWSQLSPFTYSPCPSTEFAFISPAPDLLPFQYPTTLDKSLPVLYFYTCHLKKLRAPYSSTFIFWMPFQLKSIMIISMCFYFLLF